ncbi:conserved hypothetical protein [Vibrio chagasii]|nr:conserved hypothetical protein [Vibrio chagasii]
MPISNKPISIDDHNDLIGTKWIKGLDARIIEGIDDLKAGDNDVGRVSGTVRWTRIGSGEPSSSKTQLRFFRAWLKDATLMDASLLPLADKVEGDYQSYLLGELKSIKEEMASLGERRKAVQSKLAQANSVKFIKQNELTLSSVQVIEEKYTFAHDYEKHHKWLVSKVTMDWFAIDGFIFKRDGFSLSDLANGSHGRYLELLLLEF